jgi:hypothetical protein
MLDRFPPETDVPVQTTPIKLTQAAKRRHHLLELGKLEPKEDIPKLGAIEIEANPANGGHAPEGFA